MRFINKKLVVAINQVCVNISGGTLIEGNNIRRGQSLSFVDHIFYNEIFGQQLYANIYERAAAYLFYIVKNHAFIDGNKRTGLCCALTFLEWNDIHVLTLEEDSAFDFVINIAAGVNKPDIQIPIIAQWLQTITIDETGTNDPA